MKQLGHLLEVLLLVLVFSRATVAQTNLRLELNQPVEREIAATEIHEYRLHLAADQFAHVGVGGKGVSLKVKVFAPDGRQLLEMGKLEGAFGVKPISLVAEAAGDYRIEVRLLDGRPGRYQVLVDELRVAAPPDRRRAPAEAAFLEAIRLRQQAQKEGFLSAIEKFKEALPHWRAAGNRLAEADTLLALGEVLDEQDEAQKAIEQYQSALTLYRAEMERSGEADALGNIGASYSALGETEKAIAHHQQALALRRATNDKSGEATSLYDIGFVYDQIGDETKAVEFGLQALALWRELKDAPGEARTLNLIGVAYDAMGDKQSALNYFQLSLPLRRQAGDVRGEAFTLANLGDISNTLGERRQALDYFAQARVLFKQLGSNRGEAVMLNNLGKFYALLGDEEQAVAYFKQARTLTNKIGDLERESDALNNLGWVSELQGSWRQAIDFYERAIPLYQKTKNRHGEAFTLNNLGVSHLAIGERQAAEEYFQRASALNLELKSRLLEGLVNKNFGELYQSLGRNTAARRSLEKSLAIAGEMRDARLQTAVLIQLARLDRMEGKLHQALKQAAAATNLNESLRGKMPVGSLRTTYFSSVRRNYDFQLDLLMQLHRQSPAAGHAAAAFQLSERARARSLLESLGDIRADIRQGIEPELLNRETSLRRQLSYKEQALTQLLSGKSSAEQVAAAKKELESLLAQQRELDALIRARSPHYAALTQPEPLSLKEIQAQALEGDTLLLEYALGEERGYVFAVTRNSFRVYELARRAELEAAAKDLYQSLTTDRARREFEADDDWQARLKKREREFAQKSAALSQMLLSPVAAQLGKRRLLIVAEGVLQYVPFAALTVQGQPLIANHELVSLPSASALVALRRELSRRPPAAKTLAVLADPVFTQDDARLNAAQSGGAALNCAAATNVEALRRQLRNSRRDNEEVASLARLCFTRQEAEAIAAFAPDDAKLLALDFNANHELAVSPQLGQYRILHFATHGWLDSAVPDLSAVVLSLVEKNGQPQNGFLRLHEIYNLNLPAELVVLSACETGLGKDVRGEGLIGLTRGFLYAGARRVLVSLWPVNDPATAALMQKFYRGMLKENLRPAAALAKAQTEMSRDARWRSPYYWAGFVLQGEW
ncbi:MAG TPA: CHAT domain-containing protein [Blastocatellia bacterium]|nr:CHAT domain-containing protein [Blastocatellia bacterium]HMV87234.1 CHAT domain-containing protein [Blastocatellia bacterium]HMX25867.1 CHAT domain-containing protein [Blastocatellia bacterium]HMZ21658.1 CHAT domain-containing protein [Blastocatellia bacterium]HNG33559.1 CHAT domain-containing protein [Blastocatellia bacterium]